MDTKEKKYKDYINERVKINRMDTVSRRANKDVGLMNYIIRQTSFLDNVFKDITVQQRLWHFNNNTFEIPKCQKCNSPTRFCRSYMKTCSESHASHKKNKNLSTRECEDFIKKHIQLNNMQNVSRLANKSAELMNYIINKTCFLDNYFDCVTLQQRLWHFNNDIFSIPTCQECGNNTKFSCHGSRGYNKMCSKKCTLGNARQTKTNKTCLEKYGCTNPFANKIIQEKIRQINIENLGVQYPMQSKEVREKSKETNFSKYGVLYYSQTNECREKIINTSIERYGVKHPMQDSKIKEKSQKHSFSRKTYIFPSGKIETIQGYENFTLDIIITAYTENNIIVNDLEIEREIGQIWYVIDGVEHRYYPDLYLKSEHKIVETKSDWTFKKDLEENLLKKEACLNSLIEFEFWVFDQKKNLIIL